MSDGTQWIDTCTVVNGSRYITDCAGCKTCEFMPPCRLCTWVNKERIDWIFDDIESHILHDRKWHVKEKKKRMRKLGFREGKGRGQSSEKHKKKDNGGRKGSVEPMVI